MSDIQKESQRRLAAIIIGTGFGGIGMAVHLRKEGIKDCTRLSPNPWTALVLRDSRS